MKKRFVGRKKQQSRKFKFFLLFFVFILSLCFTFQSLLKANIEIDDKTLVSLLLNNSNTYIKQEGKNKVLSVMASYLMGVDFKDPSSIVKGNHVSLIKEEKVRKLDVPPVKNEGEPLIYIYNTHQTEEYKPSTFAEISVNPTVMMVNYILKNKFDEASFPTITEERSVKDLLNMNSWNYASSYRASRIYMESAKTEHTSLTYYIDIHRDSLKREKTTIEIEGKSYAQTLFLVGTDNPNYEKNFVFTKRISDKLNERYPGLCKGIQQKGGEGVNGVYNQDFSPYNILFELGGKENTIEEVLNTSLAFSSIFMEVLKEYEG